MLNNKTTKDTKVYLASPFFNDEELLDMVKVLGALRNRKNIKVFAPFEHQNKDLEFASMEWRNATFASDVSAIDSSDVVVAVINGNYSDSGTCWEIGYAYAKNIPIIVVNLHGKEVNLMISDSCRAYIDSVQALANYNFQDMTKIIYEDYVW